MDTFTPDSEFFRSRNTENPINPPIELFSTSDVVFSVIAMLLGYLFMNIVVFGGIGLGTLIFFALLIAFALVYARISRAKQSPISIFLMVTAAVFSLNFLLSSNLFIKRLDLIFILSLMAMWCFSLNNSLYKGADDNIIYNLVSAVFIFPFRNFSKAPKCIESGIKNNKNAKIMKNIFIGLLIGIPATCTSCILLMSADKSFSLIINNLAENSFKNLSMNFIYLSIGMPIGCFLFGMVFSGIKAKQSEKLNEKFQNSCRETMYGFSPIVIYTSVIPLCIIYVIFFFTQINYFTSAFANVLPNSYETAAEYARQGFFELCAVALVNLAVIIAINYFCKLNDGKRYTMLKFLTALLSVFTLILIGTAASKMIMYISRFGLTQLRFYTTWFMALLAALFILIFIRQFKKINFAKIFMIFFVLMLAGLSFGKTDALITKYNIYAYEAGYTEKFDVENISELSLDAASEMEKLLDSENEMLRNAAEEYFSRIGTEIPNEQNLKNFTLPVYKVLNRQG